MDTDSGHWTWFLVIDSCTAHRQECRRKYPLQRALPDLCSCSVYVEEEPDPELLDLPEGTDHWYPRTRFNPELEFVDAEELLDPEDLAELE